MSKTLNLVATLLRRAQNLHNLGLDHDAKILFERVSSFRTLSADEAETTQRHLADLEDDPGATRRHLATLLVQHPDDADIHFRMARSFRADDAIESARSHILAALTLEPDNPTYLAELGGIEFEMDDPAAAVRCLKRAHELAPDNLEILDEYAGLLTVVGDDQVAFDVLRTAMFRNSGNPRFRELYRDHQFRSVADEQADAAEPVILPFVAAATKTSKRFTLDGQIFRMDAAETPGGPSSQARTRKGTSR